MVARSVWSYLDLRTVTALSLVQSHVDLQMCGQGSINVSTLPTLNFTLRTFRVYHVTSATRPSRFSACNIERLGRAWERGYSMTTFHVQLQIRHYSYTTR